MQNKKGKIYRITFLAVCATVALVLSYIETLLPPLVAAVPGIKLGLPNIVIIFVLYRFGIRDAAVVSLVRLIAVVMLFGNAMMFAYSIAGAALSLVCMTVLKKIDILSMIGVSVAGAVSHNLGQVLVAMLLLETAEIGYYMIALAISGTVSGIFVGIAGSYLTKKLLTKNYQ